VPNDPSGDHDVPNDPILGIFNFDIDLENEN
jgi:hypothetical protein